jgi:hypothetical protein
MLCFIEIFDEKKETVPILKHSDLVSPLVHFDKAVEGNLYIKTTITCPKKKKRNDKNEE